MDNPYLQYHQLVRTLVAGSDITPIPAPVSPKSASRTRQPAGRQVVGIEDQGFDSSASPFGEKPESARDYDRLQQAFLHAFMDELGH